MSSSSWTPPAINFMPTKYFLGNNRIGMVGTFFPEFHPGAFLPLLISPEESVSRRLQSFQTIFFYQM